MSATRTEEDLLGVREVPSDVYWGVHTLRAKENFTISDRTINAVPDLIRGMVQVKKAAALANAALGALPQPIADAIISACDAVLQEGRCLDQFPVDVYQGGAGTSVNMNTNEVIANLALEGMGRERGEYSYINPNDHVNRSQSTNDAYPSGFRVGTYAAVQRLTAAIAALADALRDKGAEYANTLKMGRTQLQDAVPMTVGQEFDGWAATLAEEIVQVNRTTQLLLEVNLGATAIGTGVNTPQGYGALVVEKLAEVTGYPCIPSPNLIEATSDCGAYVIVHAALKRIAVKLGKVCNDLRLLASGPRAGLKELNLPELQAGSSIMPAKVNPVIPEVVNQVCFKVIGNDLTVTLAADAGQLQLNVMEPVIGQAMFESISLLTNACDNLRLRCVDGITVNEQRCHDYVENSIGIVTYLNDVIGHHNGDLVGRECAATGRSVREVVVARGLLTHEQLDEVFSVANLMHPRDLSHLAARPDPRAAR